MGRTGGFANDVRGVSQTVAYVLLIAMVVTATGITVVVGSQAIDGVQSENDMESARTALQSVDAQISSLSMVTDASSTSFEISGAAGKHANIRRSGSLQINVSGGEQTCSAEVPLSSVRYERAGRIVGYEAGGVWERSPGGGSAMVTPPDVAAKDGTLDISIVNLTGHVDQGENQAVLNSSWNSTENGAESNLEDCKRIDEVNVTVTSSFHRAWGEYLAEETGGTLYDDSRTGDSDTVRVTLGSDQLPRRANYQENKVINMSEDTDYMDDVTIAENGGQISVDKGTDNTYLVNVRSIQQQPPEVGHVVPLSADNVTNRTRAPIDVAFVTDESGSMAGDKIDNARGAAQVAVGTMNTSHIGDRASVIGYTLYPEQRFIGTNESYLSNDSEAVNDTIDDLDANGGTNFAGAINASIAALSFRETDRPAHILLLTDGNHDIPHDMCYDFGYEYPCEDEWNERAINAAKIADSKGYTIHTFAFGEDADRETLRAVNGTTGGTFHYAADGDELKSVFENVVSSFTQDRPYVVRTPLSTNFTSDGGPNPPQIVGDTDSIARHSPGENSTFLNVNDPTTPTLFTHSFAVSGGEKVVINSTTYTCEEWEATGQIEERTVEGNTTEYPVARCSDIADTNESLPDDNITVYRNGDDATELMTDDKINGSLNSSYIDENDRFDLESNQVVVSFDYPNSASSANRLVLVYDIGMSESEASAANVVNIQETRVEVD